MSNAKHKVGYGCPPENSRFKKGQSGNPKGRPRNADRELTIAQEVMAALDEEITVTQNGKKQKLTKKTLLATTLVNNAIKGDAKATSLLLRLQGDFDQPRNQGPKNDYELPDEFAESLTDQFVAEYQAARSGHPEDGGDDEHA